MTGLVWVCGECSIWWSLGKKFSAMKFVCFRRDAEELAGGPFCRAIDKNAVKRKSTDHGKSSRKIRRTIPLVGRRLPWPKRCNSTIIWLSDNRCQDTHVLLRAGALSREQMSFCLGQVDNLITSPLVEFHFFLFPLIFLRSVASISIRLFEQFCGGIEGPRVVPSRCPRGSHSRSSRVRSRTCETDDKIATCTSSLKR